MWDGYHVFLIATLVYTRLLLDQIYQLIELPFDWLIDDAMFACLLDDLTLDFLLHQCDRRNGGFELASFIILVLSVKWLTKCASCPKTFLTELPIIRKTFEKSLQPVTFLKVLLFSRNFSATFKKQVFFIFRPPPNGSFWKYNKISCIRIIRVI